MERNGTLHLLRLGPHSKTAATRYSVTYAPDAGRGGALPAHHVKTLLELEAFLRELHVDADEIKQAVLEVQEKKRASLPNVVLTDEELLKHGLQEMSIVDSVITYLST